MQEALNVINNFHEEKGDFRYTLDRLEELIHGFDIPFKLKDELLDIWLILEEIYAGAADEGRISLSTSEVEIIFKTLDQLADQIMQID